MSAWNQTASKGGDGNFEKAPPGNHPAVCVALIDMGTQLVKGFQGAPDKEQHRAFFCWELVTEKKSDGSNHVVGLDMNLSLNEKAKLRGWIESRLGRRIADGENYDIMGELGAPCLLNVVHKDGYPRIEGMSAVPKGLAVPSPTNKPFAWHLSEFEKTGKLDIPGWVPWLFGRNIVEHIKQAKELDSAAGSQSRPSQPAPAQAAGQAPASGRPTPPNRPTPPGAASSPVRFWVDLGGGNTNDEPLDAAAAAHLLQAKGLTDKTLVCPDGSNEWKAAEAFGIKTAF